VTEPYLAGLRLGGRRVVVVGGGGVARRRLPGLVAAGAEVEVVAPTVTPAVEAMISAGEVRWHPRHYTDGDLDGAWYALALTDDPAVNERVCHEATRRRVFCVRGDTATDGTAVTPATAAHGAIRVGVVSGGDPRRSVAVRDAVVAGLQQGRLDPGPVRGTAATGTTGTAGTAGTTGTAGTAGTTGTAGPARATGHVAIVGGGPGDPDLITVRGRRLLAQADVVVADRLAPQALLAELADSVEVVDAAKLPRGRAMAQQAINDVLVDRALAGLAVVRLKGGDPFVFGRGYEEIQACAEAGVPVTVVPGVTSAIAVPGLAGIPLTHRGLAHEAVIVSGHLAPDDPGSMVDWSALAALRGTLVLLMAVERIPEIVAVLLRHGRDPRTPTAVVQDGSLPMQRVLRASLFDLPALVADQSVRPPAIVVVGEVTSLSAGAPSGDSATTGGSATGSSAPG